MKEEHDITPLCLELCWQCLTTTCFVHFRRFLYNVAVAEKMASWPSMHTNKHSCTPRLVLLQLDGMSLFLQDCKWSQVYQTCTAVSFKEVWHCLFSCSLECLCEWAWKNVAFGLRTRHSVLSKQFQCEIVHNDHTTSCLLFHIHTRYQSILIYAVTLITIHTYTKGSNAHFSSKSLSIMQFGIPFYFFISMAFLKNGGWLTVSALKQFTNGRSA